MRRISFQMDVLLFIFITITIIIIIIVIISFDHIYGNQGKPLGIEYIQKNLHKGNASFALGS